MQWIVICRHWYHLPTCNQSNLIETNRNEIKEIKVAVSERLWVAISFATGRWQCDCANVCLITGKGWYVTAKLLYRSTWCHASTTGSAGPSTGPSECDETLVSESPEESMRTRLPSDAPQFDGDELEEQQQQPVASRCLSSQSARTGRVARSFRTQPQSLVPAGCFLLASIQFAPRLGAKVNNTLSYYNCPFRRFPRITTILQIE